MAPALAVRDALAALGVEGSISILSPYFEPGGKLVTDFFESAGYPVSRARHLAYTSAHDIARTPSTETIGLIRELDSPEVDAIVQVGTNLPFLKIASIAEAFLGKAVISINTATYWRALRYLGIRDQTVGFGRLFWAF